MANVLNKLLEICEILDTKGGSGSGSSGGGSSGSVSIDGINFKRFRQEFQNTDLTNTNNIFHFLLGLYDTTKSKDLKVMVSIIDINSTGSTIPLYMIDINTNEFWNSMKIFNVNVKNDSKDSTFGTLNFGLYTITIEGNKFLSLKITNNEITIENYILIMSVYGIDTNTSEDNEYTILRYSKDQASQYNEKSIAKETLPNYISIYQNDGTFQFL